MKPFLHFDLPIYRKIYEGEMLTRNTLTIPHQIFSYFNLNSLVILKSVIDPEDPRQENLIYDNNGPREAFLFQQTPGCRSDRKKPANQNAQGS